MGNGHTRGPINRYYYELSDDMQQQIINTHGNVIKTTSQINFDHRFINCYELTVDNMNYLKFRNLDEIIVFIQLITNRKFIINNFGTNTSVHFIYEPNIMEAQVETTVSQIVEATIIN